MLAVELPQLIPDGPLHPRDAAWALGAGLMVALVARRHPRPWLALVPLAVLAVAWLRYEGIVVEGYTTREDGGMAIAATIATVTLAGARPLPLRSAAVAALGATAAIWAIVPDTELPLMTGAVLAGALVVPPRALTTRATAVLVVLPVVAAVVGSVGRPGRLGLALAAGLAGAVVALVALGSLVWVRSRFQRAGTPTTVDPSGTSSITTAPAPTTAS